MLCIKNKKIGIPCKPRFYYIKVGFKGMHISWTCELDDKCHSGGLTNKKIIERKKNPT